MITLSQLRNTLHQIQLWPLPLPASLALYLFDVHGKPGPSHRATDPQAPSWVTELAWQAQMTGHRLEVLTPLPVMIELLTVEGQNLGAVALMGPEAFALAPMVLSFLTMLANKELELNQIAQKVQEGYDQILFLFEVSKGVTSPEPRQTLLNRVLQAGVELIQVRGGIILPTNPAQEVAVYGAEWAVPLREELAQAQRRHTGVVMCNTVAQCDEFCTALAGKVESLASVEVDLAGEPELGFILFDKKAPMGLLAADRQLVGFVAEQLQAILRRDRLLATQAAQQEIALASQIYQTLVLHNVLPQHPALDIDVISRPARELGGDFHLVEQLAGGEMLFIVGDVAGKGLPAALIMSQTLATFRAVALSSSSGPAQILTRSHELLARLLDNIELFVTAFVGWIDPASGRLRYADAGHGYALWRQAETGAVISLPATGTPLGFLSFGEVEEREITLARGDQLLICSDGLPETRSGQAEFFGMDRLKGIFGLFGWLPASQLLKRLFAAMSDFAGYGSEAGGCPQDDDVTLLLVQRLPQNWATGEQPYFSQTRRVFDGQLQEIPIFTQWIQGITLVLENWGPTERHAVTLASVECFTNIVRHAYADNGLVGSIVVSAKISERGLEVQMEDTGGAIDSPNAVFSPSEPLNPYALLEHGYGLYIIRELTDEVHYDTNPNGNTWRLCYWD